ncbi:MAG TPA: GNAT family N-acetyltransferase [Patescibacteria group bacterium]|nr:GNAT family N-acetyltransferase [Patescibacteria group bacterium]
MTAAWRALAPGDLAAVARIAAQVHPNYPERPEIFAERLALFPAGCFLLVDAQGQACGYALSHPGTLGAPPPLDSLLGALPAAADCLYLHDIALLPAARGAGAPAALLTLLRPLARSLALPRLALVAVNGSADYWRGHGFAEVDAGVGSYGEGCVYLVAVTLEPVPSP